MLDSSMFLRCHRRKKDGKEHRYYSVEESRRLQTGRVVQRRVLENVVQTFAKPPLKINGFAAE